MFSLEITPGNPTEQWWSGHREQEYTNCYIVSLISASPPQVAQPCLARKLKLSLHTGRPLLAPRVDSRCDFMLDSSGTLPVSLIIHKICITMAKTEEVNLNHWINVKWGKGMGFKSAPFPHHSGNKRVLVAEKLTNQGMQYLFGKPRCFSVVWNSFQSNWFGRFRHYTWLKSRQEVVILFWHQWKCSLLYKNSPPGAENNHLVI